MKLFMGILVSVRVKSFNTKSQRVSGFFFSFAVCKISDIVSYINMVCTFLCQKFSKTIPC